MSWLAFVSLGEDCVELGRSSVGLNEVESGVVVDCVLEEDFPESSKHSRGIGSLII